MIVDKIISVLLEQKKITPAALELCKKSSQELGVPLLTCLIQAGHINNQDRAQALARVFEVPYIEKITEKMADPKLLGAVPLKFLRQNYIIPVEYEGAITIVTHDPQDFQPLDQLSIILKESPRIAIATKETIIDGINRYYPLEGTKQMIEELDEEKTALEAVEFADIEEKDILSMAEEAPIIKLVNHILVQAVKRDASDIHIEPFEKEIRVRYRIDGVMHTAFTPPKRVQSALTSRIKIMANMDIAEKRAPQDGRIEIKVADKAFDIRVSVLPVNFGERIVMRLLDKSRTFSDLTKLGLSPRDYALVTKSIVQPNGIIFVTGPTGSGKTSTLYSILSRLNQPDVNIVTVEDPIEYQMAGIGQVQVKADIGLTFAKALRSILRQDPDIVMIGEIRDQETAQIAVQAALTGHLVLSTLHTNNAPASITRLIDMGIEPFLIASSVNTIIAQRLVRQLCPKCKQPYTPSADALASLGVDKKEMANITFYKPVGCEECNMTGYKGRLAIFEVMAMTPAISQLTMEHANMLDIKKQAIKDGMTLLVQDGLRKIKEGLTTIEEVVRVATAQEEII